MTILSLLNIVSISNFRIRFDNCFHAGSDGYQLMIMTPYNGCIELLNSFDAGRVYIEYPQYSGVLHHGHDPDLDRYDFPRFLGNKRWTAGTAAPTSGTWAQGDVCWNTNPSASGYAGWICTSGGTPGTWKGFGTIEA